MPIAAVFGPVPHQVCAFHPVAELTKAVLKAVARVRKALSAQLPKLPRSRPPSPEATQRARRQPRLPQQVTDLFDHRYLYVQHSLTPAEKKTLARLSRARKSPQGLREIKDEVYPPL